MHKDPSTEFTAGLHEVPSLLGCRTASDRESTPGWLGRLCHLGWEREMTADAKHNHWDLHCKEYKEPVSRFMQWFRSWMWHGSCLICRRQGSAAGWDSYNEWGGPPMMGH